MPETALIEESDSLYACCALLCADDKTCCAGFIQPVFLDLNNVYMEIQESAFAFEVLLVCS